MRSSGAATTGGRWTLGIANAVARFVISLPMFCYHVMYIPLRSTTSKWAPSQAGSNNPFGVLRQLHLRDRAQDIVIHRKIAKAQKGNDPTTVRVLRDVNPKSNRTRRRSRGIDIIGHERVRHLGTGTSAFLTHRKWEISIKRRKRCINGRRTM